MSALITPVPAGRSAIVVLPAGLLELGLHVAQWYMNCMEASPCGLMYIRDLSFYALQCTVDTLGSSPSVGTIILGNTSPHLNWRGFGTTYCNLLTAPTNAK